jgi:hypothetical protein
MYNYIIEFNNPIYTALIMIITLTTILVGCYKKFFSKKTRLNHKTKMQNTINKLKLLNLTAILDNTFISVDKLINHFFGKPDKYVLKEEAFWHKDIFFYFYFVGIHSKFNFWIYV